MNHLQLDLFRVSVWFSSSQESVYWPSRVGCWLQSTPWWSSKQHSRAGNSASATKMENWHVTILRFYNWRVRVYFSSPRAKPRPGWKISTLCHWHGCPHSGLHRKGQREWLTPAPRPSSSSSAAWIFPGFRTPSVSRWQKAYLLGSGSGSKQLWNDVLWNQLLVCHQNK